MPSESDKWGWKHVTVFGGFEKGSGTKRWKCNHCNLRYNGSYSRVRAHLLGFTGVGVKSCPAIDRSLREALQILEEERLARKKKRNSASGKPGKRSQTMQPNMNRAWKNITKEEVDDVVARFFYADGLDFTVVNSPYFIEMARAIAASGPGYDPPSEDKLSGTFLSREKTRIEKSMALIKESWPHTACSLLCADCVDGKLGSSCVNIFVSSPRGLMFLREVDTSEGDGNKDVFVRALFDAVMEVGPINVLQIISHIGPSIESFKSLVLSKFPCIFWTTCTFHSIRILMEEIAAIDWIKPIVLSAKGIEKSILTYPHCLPFFNAKQGLRALSAKLTPSYSTVEKIFELKQTLQELVGSDKWKQWNNLTTSSEDNNDIEATVLDEEFWDRAHLFLQLFEPFVKLLSILNIHKFMLGDVFFWRFKALEAVRSRGVDDILHSQLEALIERKWEVLFSPLHAAGYMLNPKYFGRGQTKDKTVMLGWKATLDRYECESGARRVLREELSTYCRLEGSLGEEDAVECRDKMDPVAWWENFGFETPHLQTLAIKVLSQVSSITMCEETWSDDHFSCREMDRLGEGKVEDLVFVRNNLKLQTLKHGNLGFSSAQRNESSSSLSGVDMWDGVRFK